MQGSRELVQCIWKEKNPENHTLLSKLERIRWNLGLFKYPGIRSDSDMYTFGFSFKTGTIQSHLLMLQIFLNTDEAANEYNIKIKLDIKPK